MPPPPETATNNHLVSAFAYLSQLNMTIEMAGWLGNSADKTSYTRLYQQMAASFHQAFYNPAIKGYADGKQTANALALWLDGVVPPSIRPQVLGHHR